MDGKKFIQDLMFIFTYDVLNKDTRYTLMSLMQCQNMFKAETTVNIFPWFMKQKFDIPTEKLDYILEYLHNAGWITANHFEKYYEVTINYDKIEKVRTAIINYKKKKYVKEGN